MLPTHYNSPVAAQPREGSLDLPPLLVEGPFGLRRPPASGLPSLRSLPGWNAAFYSSLAQVRTERPTVVAAIADQSARPTSRSPFTASHPHARKRRPSQFNLAFLSALDKKTDRKTLSIGLGLQFCALSFAGEANGFAPLFAGTKLPSRKASAQRSFSSISRELSKARQRRSHVPQWVSPLLPSAEAGARPWWRQCRIPRASPASGSRFEGHIESPQPSSGRRHAVGLYGPEEASVAQ